MAEPFASPSDLEVALGSTVTDTARAYMALRFVSALVRVKAPAATPSDDLRDVVAGAAARRYAARRDGITQAGPFMYSGGNQSVFTPDELSILHAVLGISEGGSMTLSIATPDP